MPKCFGLTVALGSENCDSMKQPTRSRCCHHHSAHPHRHRRGSEPGPRGIQPCMATAKTPSSRPDPWVLLRSRQQSTSTYLFSISHCIIMSRLSRGGGETGPGERVRDMQSKVTSLDVPQSAKLQRDGIGNRDASNCRIFIEFVTFCARRKGK